MTELENEMLEALDLVWEGLKEGWLTSTDQNKLKDFSYMMTKIQGIVIRSQEDLEAK